MFTLVVSVVLVVAAWRFWVAYGPEIMAELGL